MNVFIIDKVASSDYFNSKEKEFIVKNVEIFSKMYQFTSMDVLVEYQKLIS